MPLLSSFERMNRMKWSQSMSSLESPHKHIRAPDGLKKPSPLNRLSTNSLNSKKSRRTLDKKTSKRSCGSEGGSQEELWKMSILACYGSQNLRTNESDARIEEFLKEYSNLYHWLNEVQLARGRCANISGLEKLAEELRRNKPSKLNFIAKSKNLAKEIPNAKEEFVWRAKHLTSQWNALEKLLQLQSVPKFDFEPAVDGKDMHDVKWLKNWLHETEQVLQPLKFKLNWNSARIAEELERHKALQAEIDEQALRVHTILKQYQTQGLTSSSSPSCIQKQNKRAENLEGRWIQLRLRVLEWVEHLSSLETKATHENKTSTQPAIVNTKWEEQTDDSIEPARKYPRLGDSHVSTVEVVRNSNNYQTTAYFGVGFYPVPNLEFDIAAEPHEDFLFDDSDWTMGQSQETESAYQSLSPVPNSVIEFTFEGSESIGMKRKTNSASLPSQNIFFQVVPTANKNVSTFYFKHNSDTEPELVQSMSNRIDGNGHEIVQDTFSVTKYNETNGTSIEDFCQEQDDLDFGQEDLDNMNCTNIGDIVEAEASMDLEAMDAKSVQNLNEIEELVQKVESLIKSSPCCAHQVQDLCWNEDEYEDEETAAGTSATSHKVERPQATSRKPLACGAISCGSKSRIAKLKAKNMIDKSRTLPFVKKGAAMNGESELAQGATGSSCPKLKLPKNHARVRQWIRAHNSKTSELIPGRKNSSSCDASAESASESESESEFQLSSDDPTTVCASTIRHCQAAASVCSPKSRLYVKKGGSSSTTVNKLSPSASTSGGLHGAGGVVWRSKKKNSSLQQRPKSFTDAVSQSQNLFTASSNPDYFVSDTALNFFGRPSRSGSSSGGEPTQGQNNSDAFKEATSKRRQTRRKLFRSKRRSLDCEVDVNIRTTETEGMMRSTSFAGVLPLEQDKENEAPEVRKPLVFHINSDNASVNTEELPSNNDQDWDSYQEKYLSEPYSEELYDQDRTLKLLAFGEDYDQVLDRPDSESSSIFGGIEPSSKKRPLVVQNRGEVQESDSDGDEFRHLVSQSVSQLRYIEVLFRKYLAALEQDFSPAEFAEMEATCEENMNSLQLILSNVGNPEALGIDLDLQSVEGVLEQWKLLKEKIAQASKLHEIQEEVNLLKGEFDNLSFSLGQVDPFDANDLRTLVHKISVIQEMLAELGGKKERLQALNEASVGTQLFLKESFVSEHIKKQMQELYALYEENYQLGSYLLSKMKYLQEAWEVFEMERNEFEKCLASNDDTHHKLKKDLSSAASTDSGHGTDFSHDSSVSDSDIEFKVKKQKLAALKKRASDLRTFIPPGSPVLDVIDKKINDAQRDFEILRRLGHFEPVDLKIIYQRKRSPSTSRKSSARSQRESPTPEAKFLPKSSSTSIPSKKGNRNWKIFRLSLTFHLALMGLFAMAWLLQPRCCENTNTFCFNLVPHLSHEKMPHI